jgi:hypothetical protein
MVGDRDDLAEMGRRGRAWVERWVSAAAVAEAYEALFEEVCGAHKAPRRAR